MGSADYYKHGDRNAICDRCGFKYKLSSLRKTWDGLLVCSKDWESEHPQNRIRIRPERMRFVEGRPEVADRFLNSLILQTGGYLLLEDGSRIYL
jgi:hypothetical protein